MATLSVDCGYFISRKRANGKTPPFIIADNGIVLGGIRQFIHHVICGVDFPGEEKEICQNPKLYQIDKDVCVAYY